MAVEHLPALIEDNAAKYGMAPRKLWSWALDAIAKDVLKPVFPKGQSLDTEFSHGGMGLLTLRKIISARRKIDHYDPSTEIWAKGLMFDTGAFEHWLTKALLAHRIPAHPKRAAGRKKTQWEALADFIGANYPHGIPGGVPLKTILRDIETKIGFRVSERTFRRALGRD